MPANTVPTTNTPTVTLTVPGDQENLGILNFIPNIKQFLEFQEAVKKINESGVYTKNGPAPLFVEVVTNPDKSITLRFKVKINIQLEENNKNIPPNFDVQALIKNLQTDLPTYFKYQFSLGGDPNQTVIKTELVPDIIFLDPKKKEKPQKDRILVQIGDLTKLADFLTDQQTIENKEKRLNGVAVIGGKHVLISDYALNSPFLIQIMAHELLHAMGLKHILTGNGLVSDNNIMNAELQISSLSTLHIKQIFKLGFQYAKISTDSTIVNTNFGFKSIPEAGIVAIKKQISPVNKLPNLPENQTPKPPVPRISR